MKTEQQWQQELSPEAFKVCRLKGTEHPGTGKYLNHSEQGIYTCACCDQALFGSNHKFNSGCGWPSFFQEINPGNITYTEDLTHNMVRTEITCSKCDSHLGHVFDDGPAPTGKRYCVNSLSLGFEAENS